MDYKEAREKWLNCLREPGAKKAYYKLSETPDSPKRCCLGHACYALGHPLSEIYENSFLPGEVAITLNISPCGTFKNPIKIYGVCLGDLTDVNDRMSLNMEEIADIIEEQFKNGNLLEYGD